METIRISCEIPAINLEILSKYIEGNFTNPERPNKFEAIWKGHRIVFTRNSIQMITKISIWERIKEDFRKFVNEDLELPKFKKEIGLE